MCVGLSRQLGRHQIGALKSKKRHVKPVTRLPTKIVWQLLCWAFIVAKRPALETAPAKAFTSLQPSNMEFRPQVIHRWLWSFCGPLQAVELAENG
jgi:hypothetical protein